MLSWITLFILLFGMMFGSSCNVVPAQPLGEDEEARVKAELAGRSFRQFEPDVDGNPRKGVIIDFTGGLSVWGQYAVDGQAVNEWEIVAEDYRVEGAADGSEVTVYFLDPATRQQFPDACEGCIDTAGVSVSIRNVFDEERIAFRVNDREGVLPRPFPVFVSWTEFREDEHFD